MFASVLLFKVHGAIEDSKQSLSWGTFGVNDFASLILF
jgi:hypothetical protein